MSQRVLRSALAILLGGVAALAASSCSRGDEAEGERSARASFRSPEAAPAGPRPPVVMLVLDEFPVDLLLGPDGRIDAGRYPSFAALAAGATFFPNAHTIYDSTPKAIPAILDGKRPEKGRPSSYRGHPRTVYDLFGRRGYRVVRDEEATSLCPPRWCPGASLGHGNVLKLLNGGARRTRLERFIGRLRPGRPTLYVKHSLLPHGPHLYLPSGKQGRRGREPLPGIETVPGFYDRHATDYNWQRLQLQIGFVDRELGRLLARLRRLGMLERSLVVVTADHGLSSEVGTDNRRVASRSNVDEVAPVPLFLKAPGQRSGRVDRSYVQTIDIVPTIADVLGLRMPYRADGRSAFSRAVRRRRSVRVIERDFSGTIAVPARAMERRRRALLRRRLRRFGSGDWASLHTGTGPNRHLLGRPVGELGPAPPGRVRATIAGAREMRSVNPKSIVLPTQVAGPIRGGRRGARRDLAVAVNGRIEAVSRSFYLRGKRQESFALNIPESALRPGPNRVEVFEVSGAGSRLRLIGRA